MTERTTISFVDLSGYTALTEAHGDEEAFRAADVLRRTTLRSLQGTAELVKTVGDSVMLAGPDVVDVARTVTAVLTAAAGVSGSLKMSAGVWTGSAVRRPDRDWFGSAVNRAARLCSLAGPGQVLVPASCASLLRQHGFHTTDLGAVHVRHIDEALEISSLEWGHPGWPVDPVCHMTVDPRRARTAPVVPGRASDGYVFCSLSCADTWSRRRDSEAASGPDPGARNAGHRPTGGDGPALRRSGTWRQA